MPTDATLAALRSAAGALKPGGRLLLESATVAESLLPEYRSELEYEAGGITMRARHDYDVRNSRLVGDFTFEDAAGRVERAGVIHHVHTVGEVVRMLEGAGFQVEQLLSEAAQRTPYTLGSRHLIAISRI